MPSKRETRRAFERKRDHKRRLDPGRRFVRAEAARKRRGVKKVTERPTLEGYGTGAHGRAVAAFLERVWAEDPAAFIRAILKHKALTDRQLQTAERREYEAILLLNSDRRSPASSPSRRAVILTEHLASELFGVEAAQMQNTDDREDLTPPASKRDKDGGMVIVVVPYGTFAHKHARPQKPGPTFEAILAEALRGRRG